MPLPPLSPQELRLGRFAGFCSVLYAAGGVLFAAFPAATFRAAAGVPEPVLSAETRFWQVLGVSMMAALAVSCAVVARSPRERRAALLPVLGAKLTSSTFALVAFAVVAEGALHTPWRALVVLFAVDVSIFGVTAALYHAAAPGVRLSSAPTQSPPEPEAEARPVRLTVSKPA
jgi:hypothetical protein